MKRACQLFVFSAILTVLIIPAQFFITVVTSGLVAFPLALALAISLALAIIATIGFFLLVVSLIVIAVVWIQEIFREKQRRYYED